MQSPTTTAAQPGSQNLAVPSRASLELALAMVAMVSQALLPAGQVAQGVTAVVDPNSPAVQTLARALDQWRSDLRWPMPSR